MNRLKQVSYSATTFLVISILKGCNQFLSNNSFYQYSILFASAVIVLHLHDILQLKLSFQLIILCFFIIMWYRYLKRK